MCRSLFLRGRQIDVEGRPHPCLALHVDEPLVLLHDPVDDGEPEPRPLPHVLGGEEGLEDLASRGVVHPRAGVGDRDEGVVTRCAEAMRFLEGVVQDNASGGNGEGPSFPHGVTRVGGKVDDDLFDLAAVGIDAEHAGREVSIEGDVLPYDPLKELGEALDYLVQVAVRRVHILLSAEGEQTPGEVGGTVGGGEDLVHHLPSRIPFRHLHLQKGSVPADHGEDVVEVVRDTACQVSHRLELLGVAQLQFEVLPVRDVSHEKVHRRFAVMHDGGCRGLAAKGFAVQPLEVELDDGELSRLLVRPLQLRQEKRPRCGMDEVEHLPGEDLLDRLRPEHAHPGVVHEDDPTFHLDEDDVLRKLDKLPVAFFALAQGLLGLAVRGEVVSGDHHGCWWAVGIPHHPQGHLHRMAEVVLRVRRLDHRGRIYQRLLGKALGARSVEPRVQDIGDVPSRAFFRGGTYHAVEFPVGAHQPALRVEQVDGIRRGIHRRAPFVGRLLKRGLRLLALGYVLPGKKDPGDRPGFVMQQGVVKGYDAFLAAFGEDRVLEEFHRLDLPSHLFGEDFLYHPHHRRGETDFKPVAPEELVLGVPQNLTPLPVDQDDGAGPVKCSEHDTGDVQVELRPVPFPDRGVKDGFLVDVFRLLLPVCELHEPEEDHVDADGTCGDQKAGQQQKMVHPAEQVGTAALRALLQVAVGKQDEDKGHPEEGEKQVKESMSCPSCHGAFPMQFCGYSRNDYRPGGIVTLIWEFGNRDCSSNERRGAAQAIGITGLLSRTRLCEVGPAKVPGGCSRRGPGGGRGQRPFLSPSSRYFSRKYCRFARRISISSRQKPSLSHPASVMR